MTLTMSQQFTVNFWAFANFPVPMVFGAALLLSLCAECECAPFLFLGLMYQLDWQVLCAKDSLCTPDKLNKRKTVGADNIHWPYFNFIKSSFHLIFVQFKWAFTYTCAQLWVCWSQVNESVSFFLSLFFSFACIRFTLSVFNFGLFQTNNDKLHQRHTQKNTRLNKFLTFLSKMPHRIQFVIYVRHFMRFNAKGGENRSWKTTSNPRVVGTWPRLKSMPFSSLLNCTQASACFAAWNCVEVAVACISCAHGKLFCLDDEH